jgi:predicted KAP-like P-loop ATPase
LTEVQAKNLSNSDSGQQILTVSYNAEIMVENERVSHSLRTLSPEVLVAAITERVKQIAEISKDVRSTAEDVSWIWSTLVFLAARAGSPWQQGWTDDADWRLNYRVPS